MAFAKVGRRDVCISERERQKEKWMKKRAETKEGEIEGGMSKTSNPQRQSSDEHPL